MQNKLHMWNNTENPSTGAKCYIRKVLPHVWFHYTAIYTCVLCNIKQYVFMDLFFMRKSFLKTVSMLRNITYVKTFQIRKILRTCDVFTRYTWEKVNAKNIFFTSFSYYTKTLGNVSHLECFPKCLICICIT